MKAVVIPARRALLPGNGNLSRSVNDTQMSA